MLMKSSDFYERGYATDGGSPREEAWTERVFIHSDVLSKAASHDGTAATVVQRGRLRMPLQYYSRTRDTGCDLDAFCTSQHNHNGNTR
jgi:hypothetical protein